ncbi:MAG: IS3 family transposase [Actinomycetaceae bacterium]|nr:IS3 family transposase [Actinomycetaceae bacterium]
MGARALRDEVLVQRVREIHERNYSVYGIGKMWHALRRGEISVGREQTGILMRLAGCVARAKGRSPKIMRKPKGVDKRPDLVCRNFRAQSPNQLWVADITYVRSQKGICLRGVCN